MRPPSPSPQPGNMGVSPLQVCPREMLVSRGLCVLLCPLRPTDRGKPWVSREEGEEGQKKERRVASLGGGIPKPAKNSQGNYSNTFPK